jgi:hypothetical protein
VVIWWAGMRGPILPFTEGNGRTQFGPITATSTFRWRIAKRTGGCREFLPHRQTWIIVGPLHDQGGPAHTMSPSGDTGLVRATGGRLAGGEILPRLLRRPDLVRRAIRRMDGYSLPESRATQSGHSPRKITSV